MRVLFMGDPNVVLAGTVRGDIHARGKVVLAATARVEGNVVYGVIEMALGAQIMGKLERVSPEVAAEVQRMESVVYAPGEAGFGIDMIRLGASSTSPVSEQQLGAFDAEDGTSSVVELRLVPLA